jgi:hypothetical protein
MGGGVSRVGVVVTVTYLIELTESVERRPCCRRQDQEYGPITLRPLSRIGPEGHDDEDRERDASHGDECPQERGADETVVLTWTDVAAAIRGEVRFSDAAATPQLSIEPDRNCGARLRLAVHGSARARSAHGRMLTRLPDHDLCD